MGQGLAARGCGCQQRTGAASAPDWSDGYEEATAPPAGSRSPPALRCCRSAPLWKSGAVSYSPSRHHPVLDSSRSTHLMNKQRLFLASCVALIATAMSFAIRGDIMGDFEQIFALNKTNLGWLAGAAFWGFGLSIYIGGPLCDVLGMGTI